MMNRSFWSILWVAFIAGVAATIVQFSIPPVLPVLRANFEATYANSALLMSLFALMTLISAVPSGFIIQKYGDRFVGFIRNRDFIFRRFNQLFAANFYVLLISRMIQEIGFGLVSVAAPSAIGRFIPSQMMNIAKGIWSTWIPVGSLIMFLFAPYIISAFHIGTYWVILMLILICSFVLYAIWIPKTARDKKESDEKLVDELPKDAVKMEVRNKRIWVVAGTFATFTFTLFSFNTWVSTYLVETSSMSLAHAAAIPAIVSFFMIGSNLYGGLLLKKYENNLLLFVLPPLLMAIIWLSFLIDSYIVLYGSAVILGVIGGVTPTILFASAPRLERRKETIGIAMSIVIIGENAGILIYPEMYGILRDFTGTFTMSFWMLMFVGLMTVIASASIWKAWKDTDANKSENADNIVYEKNYQ